MSMQLVVFALGKDEYGFDIAAVNGILRAKKFDVKSMPGTSKTIEGMINVRGSINYILNLRSKFDLPGKMLDQESKFIMFGSGRAANTGCIVDEVTDIVKLEDTDLQPAPLFVSGRNSEFVKSIGKLGERIIIILDPEYILASEERPALESG
ncbi:MAG: chemotaxis protein CheW [Pelosinus sp.]|nr:chemotaxis protein CheW [Pelosinus sp.]